MEFMAGAAVGIAVAVGYSLYASRYKGRNNEKAVSPLEKAMEEKEDELHSDKVADVSESENFSHRRRTPRQLLRAEGIGVSRKRSILQREKRKRRNKSAIEYEDRKSFNAERREARDRAWERRPFPDEETWTPGGPPSAGSLDDIITPSGAPYSPFKDFVFHVESPPPDTLEDIASSGSPRAAASHTRSKSQQPTRRTKERKRRNKSAIEYEDRKSFDAERREARDRAWERRPFPDEETWTPGGPPSAGSLDDIITPSGAPYSPFKDFVFHVESPPNTLEDIASPTSFRATASRIRSRSQQPTVRTKSEAQKARVGTENIRLEIVNPDHEMRHVMREWRPFFVADSPAAVLEVNADGEVEERTSSLSGRASRTDREMRVLEELANDAPNAPVAMLPPSPTETSSSDFIIMGTSPSE